MKTRDDFHKLIDRIEDEEVLKAYFKLIEKLRLNQTGILWNELSTQEKGELLMAYHESLDANNLVSHDEVKKQHSKWLEK